MRGYKKKHLVPLFVFVSMEIVMEMCVVVMEICVDFRDLDRWMIADQDLPVGTEFPAHPVTRDCQDFQDSPADRASSAGRVCPDSPDAQERTALKATREMEADQVGFTFFLPPPPPSRHPPSHIPISLNPLMLTAAKTSLTILMKSFRLKQIWRGF